MKSVFSMLASVIVALSSSAASAQPFIEIQFKGGIPINPFGSPTPLYVTVDARAIFDAGAMPSGVLGQFTTYDAIWAEVVNPMPSTRFSPMTVSTPELHELTTAVIEHDTINNQYLVIVDAFDMQTVSFRVTAPMGFSPSMTTLPDEPVGYDVDPFQLGQMVIIHTDADDIQSGVVWEYTGFSGLNGGFTASVQVVDGPPEPECLADINKDGQLDFFDVSAYLQLFGNGCP